MSGSRMVVRLLGGFEVVVAGRPVPRDAWRRRHAAALVKLLALAPTHRLPREVVLEALWPDATARAGGARLRKAAHHARRILGVADSVVLDGTTVALLPGGTVETDVSRFEDAALAALESADPGACGRAAGRYAGELLPDDRYEPWSEEPRQRLQGLQRELLMRAQMWGRLVALDPTEELAHREIIRDRLEHGDRAGAIRQFEQLRAVLREELGVSPDPETVALYERVLAFEGADAPTPAERARALLAWGTVHWEREDVAEAERAAREARALAVDAGLGRELADASELLGVVAYAQGRWREVFGREFVAVAGRAVELAPFVYDANLCMSEFALHEPDGLDQVASLAAELLETAEATGSDPARAVGLLLRGEVGLFAASADPDTVAEDLAASARMHDDGLAVTGHALALERLARLEGLRRNHEEAAALHTRALELAEPSPVSAHLRPLILGGMLADVGHERGIAVLTQADAMLAEGTACPPCSMDLHVNASMLLADRGELDDARRHLDDATRISRMWRGGPWHAAIEEAGAALGRAEGADVREVRQRYQAAAEGFGAAGRPRDAERCLASLAGLT